MMRILGSTPIRAPRRVILIRRMPLSALLPAVSRKGCTGRYQERIIEGLVIAVAATVASQRLSDSISRTEGEQ